jgi:hypothetical protein
LLKGRPNRRLIPRRRRVDHVEGVSKEPVRSRNALSGLMEPQLENGWREYFEG